MRIKNKSWGPLVISLPDGKSVTLGARGVGEISDEDFQNPEVQRLARAREIIVLPEEKKKAAEEKKASADAESKSSKPEGGSTEEPRKDEAK